MIGRDEVDDYPLTKIVQIACNGLKHGTLNS